MKITLEEIEVRLVRLALEMLEVNIECSLKNTPPVDDRIEPVYEEMKRGTLKSIDKIVKKITLEERE